MRHTRKFVLRRHVNCVVTLLTVMAMSISILHIWTKIPCTTKPKKHEIYFSSNKKDLRNGSTIFIDKTHFTNQIAPGEFKDEYFAPLLSLYKRKAAGELFHTKKSFKSGTVPKALLWSQPFKEEFWNAQLTHINDGLCPLPCEVIFDEKQRDTVDAVIIYLRSAKNSEIVLQSLAPRDRSQPWIMLTFEAPILANSMYKTTYGNFSGLFNRTMMYRRDVDIRVPHGFIISREDARYLPSSWVAQHVPVSSTADKGLVVTFISNCHAKSDRLVYIDLLKEYIPVDVYGSCGNLECGESMYVDQMYDPIQDPCLKLAGEQYMFFLAFENAFCVDYITEKVYNMLYYPIVPVVRGLADYSTFLPPNSYIDATKYTPKELAYKLRYLQTHPQKYLKYLQWRQNYQPSTIGGVRTLCHLCARLYDEDFYEHQVIENFGNWFESKSDCFPFPYFC